MARFAADRRRAGKITHMTYVDSEKLQPDERSAYRVFRSIGTRWSDNDAYGHVNNVVYYSWFDTVVNAHLIEHGVLNVQ